MTFMYAQKLTLKIISILRNSHYRVKTVTTSPSPCIFHYFSLLFIVCNTSCHVCSSFEMDLSSLTTETHIYGAVSVRRKWDATQAYMILPCCPEAVLLLAAVGHPQTRRLFTAGGRARVCFSVVQGQIVFLVCNQKAKLKKNESFHSCVWLF